MSLSTGNIDHIILVILENYGDGPACGCQPLLILMQDNNLSTKLTKLNNCTFTYLIILCREHNPEQENTFNMFSYHAIKITQIFGHSVFKKMCSAISKLVHKD